MRIRLAPAARKDLDGIWSYISTESSSDDAADRHLNRINESISNLARHPRLGRSRD